MFTALPASALFTHAAEALPEKPRTVADDFLAKREVIEAKSEKKITADLPKID